MATITAAKVVVVDNSVLVRAGAKPEYLVACRDLVAWNIA